jgi:hypothetical protein
MIDKELYEKIGNISKELYPKSNSIHHMVKLKEEINEVIENPTDIVEYVDCFICLISAVHNSDISLSDIVEKINEKLEINKKRKWKLMDDGTYKHIKTNQEDINYLVGVGIEEVTIVDLDSAKYLKSVGYSIPTHWYWLDKDLTFDKKGLKRVKYKERKVNHNRFDGAVYSAPTKEEVSKWLKSQNKK